MTIGAKEENFRASSPLCDLDEKKFPNPNHLNQLLTTGNVIENSISETLHSQYGNIISAQVIDQATDLQQ
jgi:hypothetical protein